MRIAASAIPSLLALAGPSLGRLVPGRLVLGGLVLGALVLGGCAGGDTVQVSPAMTSGSDSGLLQPIVRLFGNVVLRDTGVAVSGATVTVCGFGSTSTDGAGGFVFDIARTIDQDLVVLVEAIGFARRSLVVRARDLLGTSDQGDLENNGVIILVRVTDALGSVGGLGGNAPYITLLRGRTLNVAVAFGAAPAADVAVVALEQRTDSNGQFSEGGADDVPVCAPPVAGRTDATGVAALDGLDPRTTYRIVVPSQDVDLDGTPDFGTAETIHDIDAQGDVMGIAVSSLPANGAAPEIVGSGLAAGLFAFPETGPIVDEAGGYGAEDVSFRTLVSDVDEAVGITASDVSSDGSLTITFRAPVAILANPSFLFRNNLVDPASGGYDADGEPLTSIDASATDLLAGTAAGGTIHRFSPAVALPANESFVLDFFAEGGGTLAHFQVPCYRPVLDGPLALPTIDNYDGQTDGTALSRIHLQFAEVVSGRYQILSITRAGVAHPFTASVQRNLSATPDSIVLNVDPAPAVNGGQTGAAAGVFYRAALQATADSDDGVFENGTAILLADGDSVTLALSATDAEGNEIDDTLTLPVR